MSEPRKVFSITASPLDVKNELTKLCEEGHGILGVCFLPEIHKYTIFAIQSEKKPITAVAAHSHAQLRKGWSKRVIYQYDDAEFPIRAMIANAVGSKEPGRNSGGGAVWMLECWKAGQRNMPFLKKEFPKAQEALDYFHQEVLHPMREKLAEPGVLLPRDKQPK